VYYAKLNSHVISQRFDFCAAPPIRHGMDLPPAAAQYLLPSGSNKTLTLVNKDDMPIEYSHYICDIQFH
jgi:hypothetical protein